MLRLVGILVYAAVSSLAQQTGEHPDWPRWCGKVYKSGYPSFNPGGQTVEPPVSPDAPLLYVQLKPRYSLYLDGEAKGQFVVNAGLSQHFGEPFPSSSASRLDFSIKIASTGEKLVESHVDVGKTGALFSFDLASLKPQLEAHEVTFEGSLQGHARGYTATTELFYLPDKSSGSVTKLDNLNGGMLFRNGASGNKFRPLLPYGYYASYDGFLGKNDTGEIQKYADYGLNAMTPLTTFPVSTDAFAYMDKIDLPWMYDLRDGYKNLTWVEEEVLKARDGEAIFSYWSADEPDGWQDPFNSTTLALDTIRRLDPYHPVAVVLNCQDYYFGPYSAGADIIMEDVYPIGTNQSWSKWNTTCNTTIGDCGCDNCRDGVHVVQNVGNRLDDLSKYEEWLGRWPKTKIHNPQSFHGEGYWARDPTPEEEWAMNLLALNHGAQGVISWVYPAAEILSQAHGKLAKVITKSPVLDFVVGGDRPHRVKVSANEDVDVSFWKLGNRMLVSLVNSGYSDVNGPVEIAVPDAASIEATVWGGLSWSVEGGKLSVPGVAALETAMVIVKLSCVRRGPLI
ncbi:uncharacterized protein E0L32_008868 [Thyridium curvatum]|uniref:Uncharacterized protein n=1 Tax=Thyridium curvatum TaxID=1093900 RepID=A0A507AT20_9PEZI|nr:uncharacterized protein E0L32_008868 [Thyridium curvatum]TPX09846.1 hypothetical protein E0L32_008868 [Thyridium curvatum]